MTNILVENIVNIYPIKSFCEKLFVIKKITMKDNIKDLFFSAGVNVCMELAGKGLLTKQRGSHPSSSAAHWSVRSSATEESLT